MKPSKQTLIEVADEYLALSDARQESTVSYRIFGDTKRLRSLRGDGDITLGRFNAAMAWLARNWPSQGQLPLALLPYADAVRSDICAKPEVTP